ncbi:MAG: hypothetical protein M1817_002966 [Caeruleum heppii]|nr:MAG: hypothetical protein M1817_002966 [Caeruleum heppii]
MNRFRTRKKSKSSAGASGPPSEDGDVPSLPTFSSKSFLRSKKSAPIPKRELDLENALPSSDDFRTSLLMPNLSARFSMLREQDDPYSKIGKASDDSVIRPKRLSRLGLLVDVTESSPINSSIRPPFAYSRTESFASGDGYGTDDDSNYGGSILNRGRAGEGNNLFGGRQKIYKIPACSASGKVSESGGGKFLYESDVSLSAFQKLKERNGEPRADMDNMRGRSEEDQSLDHRPGDRAPSPTLSGYNRNRETSSSTTSGPSIGRMSTAATSIASQGPPSIYGGCAPALPNTMLSGIPAGERSGNKARRLYDQGLDQHLHDQQSSAMTRLDHIARQRNMGAGTPPPGSFTSLSHANSASSLHDRYNRGTLPRSASAGLRAASPPPSAPSNTMGSFQFGLSDPKPATSATPLAYIQTPPLSPPQSDTDDGSVLPASIQPGDRGKATALGAFNKPITPYDDEQFSQRQLQLQQGRNTPPPRKASPPQSHPGSRARSRQGSSAASHSPSEPSIAESNERASDPSPRKSGSSLSDVSVYSAPHVAGDHGGTFFATASGSEASSMTASDAGDDDADAGEQARPSAHVPVFATPPESQTQASFGGAPLRPAESRWMSRQSDATVASEASSRTSKPVDIKRPSAAQLESLKLDNDSPTLGPDPGLSGLVRQHLRNDSGESSVYAGPSPSRARFSVETLTSTHLARSSMKFQETSRQSSFPARDDTFEAQGNGTSHTASVEPKQNRILGIRTSGSTQVPAEEARSAHTRGASTETQKEREEFANELAQRRKKVQDNLKGLEDAEVQSRPGSRAGSRPASRSGETRQLKDGHMRMGPSFGTFNHRPNCGPPSGSPDNSAKAMKMLGISGPSPKKPHPQKGGPDHDRWKEEEERMLRSIVRGPKVPQALRSLQHMRPEVRREHQQRQRQQEYQQRAMNPPANVMAYSHRGPSPSSRPHGPGGTGPQPVGDRSRGPRGPGQHELQKPMDHIVHQAPGNNQPSSGRNRSSPPRPTERPESPFSQRPKSPASSSRARSHSKPSPPHYFAGRNVPPIQTSNAAMIGAPPRPSPITPFSANSTPSLYESSPSTALTSPASGSLAGREGVQMSSAGHRKKSVSKNDISEPTFVSCTSNITTVSLPPGASLSNGREDVAPPPVPPINPRRRQAMFGAFSRGKGEAPAPAPPMGDGLAEERSTFSDHEGDDNTRPKWQRHKLRKSNSDGANLHARARQLAQQMPQPAIPHPSRGTTEGGCPPRPVENGAPF